MASMVEGQENYLAVLKDADDRIARLEAENAALREALHDAIRRPMGTVPASAEPFVTDAELEAAERRRPKHGETA